jgi:uncharacterized protein YdaU (DUF1376 family)
MHHYQHHIGDTMLAIGHLSPAHRGIYVTLRDRYMLTEGALPDDPATLAAWTGARKRADLHALQEVLDTFFDLGPDGCWHMDDWDDQISEYQSAAPARAASGADRKAKGAARLQRLRTEHLRRRNALAAKGVIAPSRMPMPKLRALCVKHLGAVVSEALRAEQATVPAALGETPMETPVETGETSPQEPPPISQEPPTPGPAGVVGGGDTEAAALETAGGETQVETQRATALPSALQPEQAQAVAATLTAGGVPVGADDKTLQAYVLAGWTAEQLLAKKPAGGWSSLRAPWGWLKTKLSNESAAPPAAVAAAPAAGAAAAGAATHWTESAAGIIAKGHELGLGAWSEAAQVAGRQPDFITYRKRVFKAAGIDARAAAC